MMDNLEIGKITPELNIWYRNKDGDLRYYSSIEKVEHGWNYTGWFTENDLDGFEITKVTSGFFGDCRENFMEYNTLKTLTPKEAMILLGNGFVLKHLKREYLIKVNDKGDLMALFKDEKRFSALPIFNFEGFTIAALPSESEQA